MVEEAWALFLERKNNFCHIVMHIWRRAGVFQEIQERNMTGEGGVVLSW